MAIKKRPNKKGNIVYQVRVRDQCGRFYPARTFHRLVDAQKYERALLDQRDKGLHSPPTAFRDLRFGEYWNQWSVECRSSVSDGWKLSQDQMARDYILPELATLRLRDIRPRQIGTLLGRLRENLSPQTVTHIYNLLHKVMKDAKGYEYISENPVRKEFRPKLYLVERQFLSPERSRQLLTLVRAEFLGPAIWLSLLAGLRPSEVQALKWDAVDFERKLIVIKAAYKRKVRRIEPFPKQGDWGYAPIPQPLLDYLTQLKAQCASEYVAPGESGRMLQYEVFLRGLKRHCKALGFIELTPHELRHSCTELYVEQGAGPEDIRRLLNQSSLSVTQRYIHRTDERLMYIAGKVGVVPALGSSSLGTISSLEHKMSTWEPNLVQL